MKERFTKKPVLAVPDLDKKNKNGSWCIGQDGQWRPVAYLSKSLNEVEKNYEIHDNEMLVVIKGLES